MCFLDRFWPHFGSQSAPRGGKALLPFLYIFRPWAPLGPKMAPRVSQGPPREHFAPILTKKPPILVTFLDVEDPKTTKNRAIMEAKTLKKSNCPAGEPRHRALV